MQSGIDHPRMARLHEYQGKALLAQHGIHIPRGAAASSAIEAEAIARSLNGPVVIKIQAWTTGRAAIGGVASFAGFYCAYHYDVPLGPAEVAIATALLCLVGAAAWLRQTLRPRAA